VRHTNPMIMRRYGHESGRHAKIVEIGQLLFSDSQWHKEALLCPRLSVCGPMFRESPSGSRHLSVCKSDWFPACPTGTQPLGEQRIPTRQTKDVPPDLNQSSA
jgi:hypothetical protein